MGLILVGVKIRRGCVVTGARMLQADPKKGTQKNLIGVNVCVGEGGRERTDLQWLTGKDVFLGQRRTWLVVNERGTGRRGGYMC